MNTKWMSLCVLWILVCVARLIHNMNESRDTNDQLVSRLWMYLFWNMNTSRRNTKTMSLYLFLKMNKPRDTSESCYLASQNYSSLLQKSPIKETKEPSKRDTSESCYMSYQLFCVCVRRHAIYGAKWHELCYGAKWHEPSDMSQVTWVTWLILSLL